MWTAPRDGHNRLFVALMVALIALAWLVLWVWGQSPYGRFLSHHSLEAVRGDGTLVLVFVAGWTLMVVAMMLPTSLPLVALFRTLVRGRPDRAANGVAHRRLPRRLDAVRRPGLLCRLDPARGRRAKHVAGGQPRPVHRSRDPAHSRALSVHAAEIPLPTAPCDDIATAGTMGR